MWAGVWVAGLNFSSFDLTRQMLCSVLYIAWLRVWCTAAARNKLSAACCCSSWPGCNRWRSLMDEEQLQTGPELVFFMFLFHVAGWRNSRFKSLLLCVCVGVFCFQNICDRSDLSFLVNLVTSFTISSEPHWKTHDVFFVVSLVFFHRFKRTIWHVGSPDWPFGNLGVVEPRYNVTDIGHEALRRSRSRSIRMMSL